LLAALLGLPSVDEIIARHLAARGGEARLHSVQSERLRGTIAFGKGAPGPLAVDLARPGKIREEVQLSDGKFQRASDGKQGFALGTDGKRRALSAEELKNLAGSADFDGPLVDRDKKDVKVKLVGVEPVEGRDAYRLEVTMADGQVRHELIDAQTFLDVKWEGTLHFGGKAVRMWTFFRDFREVSGVKLAFRCESHSEGSDDVQLIVYESIELDAPIDPARFQQP
jgi:hypothetical protein